MTTYHDLVKKLSSELKIYEAQESINLVEWLLEYHMGLRRVDMTKFMEEDDLPIKLIQDFDRLKSGEPIQHILGKAPFYGRDFRVTPDTLIPRNETEELVHWILKDNRLANLKVLDIGTGSGCIPITLALEMDAAQVFGVDISESALKVARANAKALHAEVSFSRCDILNEKLAFSDLDIVVSNPPYVLNSDKSKMHSNVLDHEPGIALFVPDENPLLFYRAIADQAKKMLKHGGKLYVEIHENFGDEVVHCLENLGYSDVILKHDLNGKSRMVVARHGLN